MRPTTLTTHTIATHDPAAPPSITTLRWSPMRPATTAPNPSSAARLNTFDPITTPEPTACSWWARAVTAEVISGVSAARAARRPSRASENPIRSPSRSSRVTRTQLVPRLMTAPARKAAMATSAPLGERMTCRPGFPALQH
jgi:hypothetical protein